MTLKRDQNHAKERPKRHLNEAKIMTKSGQNDVKTRPKS